MDAVLRAVLWCCGAAVRPRVIWGGGGMQLTTERADPHGCSWQARTALIQLPHQGPAPPGKAFVDAKSSPYNASPPLVALAPAQPFYIPQRSLDTK